jgi:DNA-binding NarL/FixJ family response regulator
MAARREGEGTVHGRMTGMPIPGVIRILIAEDQYLMREGTRRLLEEADGIEVVGTAADYEGVLAEARRLRPDLVLMDIKMPPTHTTEGIHAAHAIKAERPGTGILVLSQHDDESYVWALLEKGIAGYGYLHKIRVGDIEQLLRAIREVAGGGCVVDPRIVHRVLAHRAGKPGSRLSELTQAERDVLRLIADGRSNIAIAKRLNVSVGSVEKRIASLLSKLELEQEEDVNRRVAAVLIYLRETAPLS